MAKKKKRAASGAEGTECCRGFPRLPLPARPLPSSGSAGDSEMPARVRQLDGGTPARNRHNGTTVTFDKRLHFIVIREEKKCHKPAPAIFNSAFFSEQRPLFRCRRGDGAPQSCQNAASPRHFCPLFRRRKPPPKEPSEQSGLTCRGTSPCRRRTRS